MSQWSVACRPDWVRPEETIAQGWGGSFCVWLDSVTHGCGAAPCAPRYSILAANPFQVLRAHGDEITLSTAAGGRRWRADPFAALAAELAQHRHTAAHPFPVGAAIGYFGYDLKRFVERVPARAVADLGLPDLWFGFYDNLLVFDHVDKKVWQITSPVRRPRQACRSAAVSDRQVSSGGWGDLRSSAGAAPGREPPLGQRPSRGDPRTTGGPSRPDIESNFTRAEYCRAVERAKEYIAAGDIYQVNLSQRFQCSVDVPAPAVYDALRAANPAPYSAYLDIGDAQILSASPECFLHIRDREVVTRPIKGTRPRGRDAAADRRIAAELLHSPKDNAELVMITDLERNDLGRVCEFGSVRVSELVRVEQYATVLHLVSTVEGRLRRGVGHVDCVRACFPGGSITGAPKIRAMQIIDELEPQARGLYTGAIGFFGFNGITHLNIAIRTAIQQNQRLTFHAGGGIVADSVPEAEYEETLAKAQGIIHALDQLRVRQRAVPA